MWGVDNARFWSIKSCMKLVCSNFTCWSLRLRTSSQGEPLLAIWAREEYFQAVHEACSLPLWWSNSSVSMPAAHWNNFRLGSVNWSYVLVQCGHNQDWRKELSLLKLPALKLGKIEYNKGSSPSSGLGINSSCFWMEFNSPLVNFFIIVPRVIIWKWNNEHRLQTKAIAKFR